MAVPKYKKFQRKITLLTGIEDIHPYELTLPEPPPIEQFVNYGLPANKQFFKKTEMSAELSRLCASVRSGKVKRADAILHVESKPELVKEIEGFWAKRLYGDWQIINGIPLHISPTYWFYLNFWPMNKKGGVGTPDFRCDFYHNSSDLQFFYFWDYLVKTSPFCEGCIEFTQRQVGKCLGKDTPIRMFDGSIKPVQDIIEGDLIMGNDSSVRQAFNIVSGQEEMYKITPYHGDSFGCNGSHILSLYYNNCYKDSIRGWQPKTFITITVNEYLKLGASIKKHLCMYRTGWGNEWATNEHYIPSYLLGAYLGDGTRHWGHITSFDKEIISEMRNFCDANDFKLTNYKGAYRISKKTKGVSQNPYRKELKRLGVLPNKHIPNSYLVDSRENRLELLAGLLDTDGYLGRRKTKNGVTQNYEITQKDKKLAYQILELAQSLGFNASIKSKKATLKRQDKPTYECVVYRVTIFGDIHLIPCRVERKKATEIVKRNNPLNSGFNIQSLGIGDYYGFAVDKNHLFLLGDGTVVHNSFKLGVTGCEPALRIREYHSGYQSKTDTDISALFGKCIIRQWRNLPFFFSPIYSNSTFPKGQDGLQFTPRSNRGNNDGVETLDEGELMGSVTYRSSDEKAYDNATLDFYGADEIGKTTEVNIHKRWSMVRPALRQKDGKSYQPSTVEELEKMGGKHFKKLWDQSCRIPDLPKEINALGEFGETISGLWPWFTPSYINQHYDQFGFSVANEINEEQKVFLRDVSKQKYWWMTGREAIDHMIKIAGNQEEQQEIIRKHPRNIKEAFLSANGKSYFNLSILNDNLGRHRMGYTVAEREYMKWGMFRWKNGVFGGDVEFVEADFANAKFHASYFPPEGMRNVKVPVPGGKFKPANAALFRSGADPFKFDTQDVKYKKDMSWASQHIYMFYDETVDGGKPRKEWISNNIIYEYYYRGDHQSVDEMCEDFLMACIFYGCKVYPERNNDDVLKYFKRHGFEHYTHFAVRVAISEGNLIYKQEATAGATTNDKTIEKMWRHVQDFVNNDAAACPFYRTIQDVKDVDRADLNPFDLFVSLSYTLMSAYEADIATKQEEQKPTTTREILEAIYEADWSDL